MSGRRIPAALCALALLSGVRASAQSINIDFGDENGAPPAGYAAAGLAGTWNAIHVDFQFPPKPVGPYSLVGLDGKPVGATLTIAEAVATLADIPVPHPELGDHQPLLGDGLLGNGPKSLVTLQFDGLEDGFYRVIPYTWYYPAQLFAMVVFVDGASFVQPTGGYWTGDLAVGITHMAYSAQVVGGRLSLAVTGSGDGAFFNGDTLINGVQLWKVDTRPPVPCPPGATGDCYAGHAGPGCADAGCCQAVCQIDPSCCDVAWDGLCAGLANLLPGPCASATHPNCNASASPCSQPVGEPTPGCNDPDCCRRICAMDPYCCNYGWDGVCAAEARLYCSEIPAGCGHPEAGDCFAFIGLGNPTPYCNDAECCERVCAYWPPCCEQGWSGGTVEGEPCVSRAHVLCNGGMCGEGRGSCFTPHEPAGGCSDPECCQRVCEMVPACCMDDPEPSLGAGWNQNCVDFAMALCPKRQLGDVNCDDFVNSGDTGAFTLALIDPSGYRFAHPFCNRFWADMNRDGRVDGLDIQLFVENVVPPSVR